MSMYYRKLWAEVGTTNKLLRTRLSASRSEQTRFLQMLAFDVHETFDREGNERSTGERFKTAMLNHGAGETQAELYRRFQVRS